MGFFMTWISHNGRAPQSKTPTSVVVVLVADLDFSLFTWEFVLLLIKVGAGSFGVFKPFWVCVQNTFMTRLQRCDSPKVNVFLRLDSCMGARRQRRRSLYSPFFVGKWGQISLDFVFLHHGASLCTSAPIEGLHMYHQPCSMTNYICEMRLWGGLPNQSLLSGNVHRFQHVVLYDVCEKTEWCQLGQKWLTCKSHAQTALHPTPPLCPVMFCFHHLFLLTKSVSILLFLDYGIVSWHFI